MIFDIPINKNDLKPFKILSHLKIRNIKSKEFVDFEKIFNSDFIDRFIYTCEINNGIGLCGSQIGNFSKILLVKKEPFDKNQYYVIINPTYKPIIEQGKSTEIEGCLSVNNQKISVERWNLVEITCDLYDKNTNTISKQTLTLTNLESRIFLHEYDHLFGRDIVLISSNNKKKGK